MPYTQLLSIKEFSKLTGIKSSTLRYFDDIGVFKPLERGENGYRYYSPDQLTTINAINALSDLDVPIKIIADIVKKRTPESVLSILDEKASEIYMKLKALERSLKNINTFQNLIREGMDIDPDLIEIKYMESFGIIIGPETNFPNSGLYYDPFMEFCSDAPKYGIDLNLPIGGLFNDFEAFAGNPNTPNYFFSVDPDGRQAKLPGNYLVAYSVGNYGDTTDLSTRLINYIKEHKLETIGPVYNIFLLNEITTIDRNEFLMQASVRVKD